MTQRLAGLFLVLLFAPSGQNVAGPVPPWKADDPLDEGWLHAAPRSLRLPPVSLDGETPSLAPYLPLPAPWPGFEFGLGSRSAALPVLPPPHPAQQLDPISVCSPIHSLSLGGQDWGVYAVLEPDDPAAWSVAFPCTALSEREPGYASALARAGAPVDDDDSGDLLAVIPEPTTLSLLGLGALSLLRRRRRH